MKSSTVVLLLVGIFPLADPARALPQSNEVQQALEELAAVWADLSEAEESEQPLIADHLLEATRACVEELEDSSAPSSADCQEVLTRIHDLLYLPAEWWLDGDELATLTTEWSRSLVTELGDEWQKFNEHQLAEHALERHDLSRTEEVLYDALERWPEDPWLRLLEFELARLSEDWPAAMESLAASEVAAASFEGGDEAMLRGKVLLARCALDIRLGRADRALLDLERIRQGQEFGEELPPAIASDALLKLADVAMLCDAEDRVLEIAGDRARVLPEHRPDFDLQVAMAKVGQAFRTRVIHPSDLEILRDAADTPNLTAMGRVIGQMALAELLLLDGKLADSRRRLREARRLLDQWSERETQEPPVREWSFLSSLFARLSRLEGNQGQQEQAEAELLRWFRQLLDNWRQTPLLPGGIGFLRSPLRRSLVHEVLSATAQRDGASAAFDLLMEVQTLGSFARQQGLAPPSIAEIEQHLLDDGEGLLVYLPSRNGCHLFVLAKNTLLHLPLPTEHQVLQSLQALDRGDLSLLSNVLPDPAKDLVNEWSLVRVVGADLIQGLVVEQLPFSAEQRLGEAKPVAHLPSVPVGIFLRRRRDSPGHPVQFESDLVLILGPADPKTGVDPAPLTHRSSLSPFPESRTRTFGRDTPPAHLGRKSASSTQLLHLLCHGVVDRTREVFAGLLLDDNGETLWSDELARWELPPLVVLSACSSGEGPLRVGEDGVSQLTGATFLGGADTVIAATGPLDRDLTLATMKAFHEEIARGRTPADALRRARNQVSQTHGSVPGTGELRVFGLGDQPLRGMTPASDRSWPRTMAMTVGALLILTGIAQRHRSVRASS